MTMTLEQEREAFEKWVSEQPWFLATLYLARSGDEYADPCINSRWQGWKAHHLSQPAQVVDVLLNCALDAAAFLNAIGRYDYAQTLRDAVHAIWPESAKSIDAQPLFESGKEIGFAIDAAPPTPPTDGEG